MSAGEKKRNAASKTPRTVGFGVPADSADPHHFVVTVPRGSKQPVTISEYLGARSSDARQEIIDRVQLERSRWTVISQATKKTFNERLKSRKLPTARWKTGENLVDRLLGKELCVLAWAIEDASEDVVPVALRNWLALRPEERWWLFGMTAATSGNVGDHDGGWRIALRYALTDTARADVAMPRLEQSAGGLSEPVDNDQRLLA